MLVCEFASTEWGWRDRDWESRAKVAIDCFTLNILECMLKPLLCKRKVRHFPIVFLSTASRIIFFLLSNYCQYFLAQLGLATERIAREMSSSSKLFLDWRNQPARMQFAANWQMCVFYFEKLKKNAWIRSKYSENRIQTLKMLWNSLDSETSFFPCMNATVTTIKIWAIS